jgi:GDSL-like Lipase/Acylhydrolase family
MTISTRTVLGMAAVAGGAFLYGIASERYQLFPVGIVTQVVRYIGLAPIAHVDDGRQLRTQMFEAFKPQADIVMLGDSITAWPDWRDLFPGRDIANRGLFGETTAGAAARLDSVIALKPRKVFIMLGVNDLHYHGQSPESVFSVYSEIVQRLSSSGIGVVVQSVLMTSNAETNAKAVALNAMLGRRCQQTGLCRFVDLSVKISPSDTVDGLHLAPKGYEIWRAAIADEIAASH